MIEHNGIAFALDTPNAVFLSHRDYALTGWCVTKPGNEVEILSVINGVEVPIYSGLPRPDVAQHFNNPSALKSGFIARFRRATKSQSVSVIAKARSGARFPLTTITLPPLEVAPSGNKSRCYRDWLQTKEPLLFWKDDEIADRLNALTYHPLISVILPTYNTPPYFLHRCLQSVLDQHYRNWNLCVADDASPDPSVLATLEAFAARDPRIQITARADQGGISAASNSALECAQGDYVVLLDHDDELHPHALLEVARFSDTKPDHQLVYSDEDKIDQVGVRSYPSFKPDFDPNMFLSQNYLGHLIALKRGKVMEIGGFRPSCDGAQDWDLLIRAVETMSPDVIGHIPKPLYHWRMHADSTAHNLNCKPYAVKAWTRVLQDHIDRTGKKATITPGLFHGSLRIKYPAPRGTRLAVFLRLEDGPFQPAIVQLVANKWETHLYNLVGCSITPLNPNAPNQFPCSITEIEGDIFIFINGALEGLNHLFFEELIAQASRADCGLVTGVSVNSNEETLSTGFLRTDDGRLEDPLVGIKLFEHGYMGQVSLTRILDTCPITVFAIKRQDLIDVGGLGVLDSSHMSQVISLLADHVAKSGRATLFTPYAVASFIDTPDAKPATGFERTRHSVRLNPNLLDFKCTADILSTPN